VGVAMEAEASPSRRVPHAASTSGQARGATEDARRGGARDTGIRLAMASKDDTAYRPTREEYRRAIERSTASESHKRFLLRARPPPWPRLARALARGRLAVSPWLASGREGGSG